MDQSSTQQTIIETIIKSQDLTELGKKYAIFLIKQSRGFTKPVRVIIKEGRDGLSAEDVQQIGHGFHDMNSDNCHTHLCDVMRRLDLEFFFASHRGECDFRGKIIRRKKEVMSYTLWLGRSVFPSHIKLARSQKLAVRIDVGGI